MSVSSVISQPGSGSQVPHLQNRGDNQSTDTGVLIDNGALIDNMPFVC